MLRKLLPALLGLTGLAGGLGAGYYFRPVDQSTTASDGHAETTEDTEGHETQDGHGEAEETGPEFVKMNNQFVVPVVDRGRVAAMVVLSLSLEVEAGNTEAVYAREPKLRDAFLQVLFDHANMGGFSGSFTDGSNLVVLRTGLTEAARMVMGSVVSDVLITDIARQDS